MKVLIILLLLIAVFVFLVTLILYTVNYYEERWSPLDSITMKFSTWLKMYEVCPKNWDIEWVGMPCASYINSNGKYVYKQNINISFLTAWQYVLWKRLGDKRKNDRKQAMLMREFLSYMQDDINRLAKESQRQIDKESKESAKYIKALVEEDGAS